MILVLILLKLKRYETSSAAKSQTVFFFCEIVFQFPGKCIVHTITWFSLRFFLPKITYDYQGPDGFYFGLSLQSSIIETLLSTHQTTFWKYKILVHQNSCLDINFQKFHCLLIRKNGMLMHDAWWSKMTEMP